ncbi:ATP-binding protein [Nonomuraea terrae]|uniref:ATP-binding protein n=1 Tax=Nonomuraea terrae TaxID=2530383 RepID=A0A4V2YL09_9ACTN|nr:AAA family ATPase [Nonomuraea terrae]TDD44867.1 ATP-binding protein [Nonomuraea terrae]
MNGPARRPGRLILICGLPGAGKTTLARRLAAERAAVRLCPDEWLAHLGLDPHDEAARDRLEKQLWRHARDLLRLGQTVILEYGFWARSEREELRLAARAMGAAVELHYLTAPLDELWRRVEARHGWGTVPITRAMLEQGAAIFEPPDDAELSRYDRPENEEAPHHER